MCRTCRSPWKPLVRTSQSRGQDAADRRARFRLHTAHGPHPGGDAGPAVLRRARRARRASAEVSADQLDRSRRPAVITGRALRSAGRHSADSAVTGPAPQDLEFFNGLGGFAAHGTRVRHPARAGAVDPGAVDQRRRQSRFRIPGCSGGQRLHLVAEQPREPAHALVERSGHRSAGRSHLPARRRDRRALGTDGGADSRPARVPFGSPRAGLQPVHARVARRGARPVDVRPAR